MNVEENLREENYDYERVVAHTYHQIILIQSSKLNPINGEK